MVLILKLYIDFSKIPKRPRSLLDPIFRVPLDIYVSYGKVHYRTDSFSQEWYVASSSQLILPSRSNVPSEISDCVNGDLSKVRLLGVEEYLLFYANGLFKCGIEY